MTLPAYYIQFYLFALWVQPTSLPQVIWRDLLQVILTKLQILSMQCATWLYFGKLAKMIKKLICCLYQAQLQKLIPPEPLTSFPYFSQTWKVVISDKNIENFNVLIMIVRPLEPGKSHVKVSFLGDIPPKQSSVFFLQGPNVIASSMVPPFLQPLIHSWQGVIHHLSFDCTL